MWSAWEPCEYYKQRVTLNFSHNLHMPIWRKCQSVPHLKPTSRIWSPPVPSIHCYYCGSHSHLSSGLRQWPLLLQFILKSSQEWACPFGAWLPLFRTQQWLHIARGLTDTHLHHLPPIFTYPSQDFFLCFITVYCLLLHQVSPLRAPCMVLDT